MPLISCHAYIDIKGAQKQGGLLSLIQANASTHFLSWFTPGAVKHLVSCCHGAVVVGARVELLGTKQYQILKTC
eukprot:scaffold169706_cov15-Tisochrysis_lutea.AAC.1